MPPALLLTFTFVLGSGSVISLPAYQSLIPELVPRTQLAAASTLGSISVNLARAIGPGDRRRAHRSHRGWSGLRDQRGDLSRLRHRRGCLASAGRDIDAATGAFRVGPARGWPLRSLFAGHAADAPAHRVVPGPGQCVLGDPAGGGDTTTGHGCGRVWIAPRCARCRSCRRLIPPADGFAPGCHQQTARRCEPCLRGRDGRDRGPLRTRSSRFWHCSLRASLGSRCCRR